MRRSSWRIIGTFELRNCLALPRQTRSASSLRQAPARIEALSLKAGALEREKNWEAARLGGTAKAAPLPTPPPAGAEAPGKGGPFSGVEGEIGPLGLGVAKVHELQFWAARV